MAAFRESVNKEILVRYKKDKIKQYLEENPSLLEGNGIKAENKAQYLDLKVEQLYKDAYENPEELKKYCGYLIIEYSDTYDLSTLENLKNESKKHGVKSFHITEIERISSNLITSYSFGVSLKKTNKYLVNVSDVTGIFKVHFSNGEFMYYAKWVSGGGKSRAVEGMYGAEREVWLKFLKMMKVEKKKSSKPKNGIFRLHTNPMSGGGLIYTEMKDLQETPIVHPAINILNNDMKYYFENVSMFTRFGMPGVRKALLVGPPGTGKTSLSIKLAKKYQKEKCIAFATSITDAAAHLQNCAKYKVSTLVILEDAESTLANANAALLNFLDGVDLPKNLEGSYIIMTTNHPDRIEPRIIKRPGRVDKIIEFGVLSENYALQCAEIYFDKILFNNKNRIDTKIGRKTRKELYPIINEMTGAEIKELSQASASYAASEKEEVTVSLIGKVKNRMKEDIKDIMKYAEDSSSISKRKGVGFLGENDGDETFKEEFLLPVIQE